MINMLHVSLPCQAPENLAISSFQYAHIYLTVFDEIKKRIAKRSNSSLLSKAMSHSKPTVWRGWNEDNTRLNHSLVYVLGLTKYNIRSSINLSFVLIY